MTENTQLIATQGGSDFMARRGSDFVALDNGFAPVLRGGSWWDSAGCLRCAVRNWSHPGLLLDLVGFRLLLRPPAS